MGFFDSKRLRKLLLPIFAAVPIAGGFYYYGDDVRKAFNDVAESGRPLDQREIIVTRRANDNFGIMVSGEEISKNGNVPVHAFFSREAFTGQGNMNIDWTADDAFTRTFRAMEDKAAAKIAATPALTRLNSKKNWTPADRLAWDSGVANIIAGVVEATPGLDRYRSDGTGTLPHLHRLNDLSEDITNHTYTHTFDCKQMSVVKVALQERMAERFLPAAQRTRYFYTVGDVEFRPTYKAPGGHAFIVAEKCNQVVGIVEATGSRDVFHQPVIAYSFSDVARGKTVVTKDSAVYGIDFTHEEADRLRQAFGITPPAKGTAKQFRAANTPPRPPQNGKPSV